MRQCKLCSYLYPFYKNNTQIQIRWLDNRRRNEIKEIVFMNHKTVYLNNRCDAKAKTTNNTHKINVNVFDNNVPICLIHDWPLLFLLFIFIVDIIIYMLFKVSKHGIPVLGDKQPMKRLKIWLTLEKTIIILSKDS